MTIVAPIQIKHVHSSVSYQWVIYQKYHWHGRESSSGYGALSEPYDRATSKCMEKISKSKLSEIEP